MAYYTDKDPDFGLDDFGRPKITDESQTLINNLLTILLAKPGNFPSQPSLGLDISQYLYSTEGGFSPEYIKAKLVSQCSDFKACVEDGSFDIALKTNPNNGQLYILIGLPVKTEDNQRLLVGIFIEDGIHQIFRFTYSVEGYDLNEIDIT